MDPYLGRQSRLRYAGCVDNVAACHIEVIIIAMEICPWIHIRRSRMSLYRGAESGAEDEHV